MKKNKPFELPPIKDFLHTVPEAAKILGVCPRTVERMIRSGDMESCIVGRRCRRVRDSVIQRHMGQMKPDESSAVEKPPRQMSLLNLS